MTAEFLAPAAPEALPRKVEMWTRGQWQERKAGHDQRVQSMADAFVQRRSRGEKHPVHDFLFTYYNFSPAKLKQWQPPLGIAMEVAGQDLEVMPWLARPPIEVANGLASLTTTGMTEGNRGLASWVASLCQQIQGRAPRFRCFGLHEWAMVYRQPEEKVRHQGYELRMSPEELAAFVESQTIGCSHYDAYRFFTPEARPLNVLQPVLESRLEMEQGGCLHANMDLYKWASKLWPWTGSELVGKCFALACEIRELDMRASPYDLAHLGYEPVRIESPEGRARYEAEQRALAEKATPLRAELLQAATRISTSSET